MNPLYFLNFIIFTIITLMGIFSPSEFKLFPILFVFVGIPLIDAVIGVDKSNPNVDQEKRWKSSHVWAPTLYLYSFTHFGVIICGGLQSLHSQSFAELIIMGITAGLYTGGLGITVGHELCHKKEFIPRFVADLLLASVWYQHFAVEHVRGHHLAVSTPEDPASARKNENVYRFLWRTISGSLLHAFQLDSTAVIKGMTLSLVFTLFASYFGSKVLVFFCIQSFVAILLLELVNYVEHYGLTRKQLTNGRYEKVLPIHSWNSAHKFSNILLFNLQRHSDHHAMAHLPYTVLKHQEDAPQLPSGYPGMILLALVPPLWFKFMNPKVMEWEKTQNLSL
jgi:alkane 1-monooxygenase